MSPFTSPTHTHTHTPSHSQLWLAKIYCSKCNNLNAKGWRNRSVISKQASESIWKHLNAWGGAGWAGGGRGHSVFSRFNCGSKCFYHTFYCVIVSYQYSFVFVHAIVCIIKCCHNLSQVRVRVRVDRRAWARANCPLVRTDKLKMKLGLQIYLGGLTPGCWRQALSQKISEMVAIYCLNGPVCHVF